MLNIAFEAFNENYLPLWNEWVEAPHVKESWFIEGYETTNYIIRKIQGNGYDYPFVIFIEHVPIGYIQCCDLYAYRRLCSVPKGVFTQEEEGTFCLDLFIADHNYLNKGYGTKIVKAFTDYIFTHFKAKKIVIDPDVKNIRAIRCYEKAGFVFYKEAFDGVTQCHLMKLNCLISSSR